jgi:hypothetical protein
MQPAQLVKTTRSLLLKYQYIHREQQKKIIISLSEIVKRLKD